MSDLFALPGSSAVFSECGLYRLRLDRDLGRSGPTVALIGVNPSTADAEKNDATIRKDMGFGERLGWGKIIKVNKFAFRATDVRELKTAAEPIGWDNDSYLGWAMAEADIVVACWGPLGKLPRHLRTRYLDIVALAERMHQPLMCFGVAQDGQPRHTLMLSYDTPLVPWVAP